MLKSKQENNTIVFYSEEALHTEKERWNMWRQHDKLWKTNIKLYVFSFIRKNRIVKF